MAADGVFAVLFPSPCRICAAPLARISRLPVCDSCLDKIHAIEGPRCAACGERVPNLQASERDGALLCFGCRHNEPAFTRAAAYGSYEGGLRDLIHLLKYEHVRPAAGVLGRMVAEVVADLVEGASDPVVVPVPLHPSKWRERGFNQAELIARAALKLHPAALDTKVNAAALVRRRDTGSQIGLTPAQRRENMRGAFAVVRPLDLTGRDILLIDDVLTTGATANECARVLLRAGARRVFVATVARALKPEVQRLQPAAVSAPGEQEPLRTPMVMAAHA